MPLPMPRVRSAVSVVALLLMSTLGACVGRATAVTSPTGAGAPLLRVYDAKAGRWSTFDAMIASLARADVVFFGEQHDDPDTHAAELAVFAALGERRAPVLSLEMFERDVQPLLDRYLAGAVSESLFVAGSRPWDRYRTDYRGMVEIARVRGWPVVAANVPRRIASAVSRRGLALFDTLNASERALAARENVCARDAYYVRFAETMQGHGGPASATDSAAMRAMTDRFYEAQCVKDEAMAEAIVRVRETAGRDRLVMHVNGSFHSDFGLGTASRVARRDAGVRIGLITAIPSPSMREPTAEERRRADWLLFTRGK